MNSRILIVLALATLAGCKSTPKEAEVDANGNKIEYVYYTPTGSSIPVRIRKDQMKPTEEESKQGQETFKQIQQRGVRPPKDTQG